MSGHSVGVKRSISLLAGAAVVGLVAAGCGSGGNTGATGPSTSTQPSMGATTGSSGGGSSSANTSLDVFTNGTGFTAPSQAPQTGCTPGQYSSSHPLVAAWVYVGAPSDAGWTHAHDQGRLAVAKHFGSSVKTLYKENVPEGPQTAQVIQQLINQGANIIFSTSFGYQPATLAAAKANPKVLFEMATGTEMAPNMAEYYGAGEDGDYLGGMAAGYASKTGKIGFVAPFPIPEVVREIDAFTMGARYAHPGATVRVVWTNTWFDPAKERQAAQSLVSAGVDALADGQDSPTTGQVAKANGLPWVGYDSNQERFAPGQWLTGTTYHWGAYYIHEVQAAMNCSWRSHFYYGGLKDGFVQMAPYGKSVSASAQAAINKRKQEIVAGTFNPFSGPIKNQAGQVKVPKGTTLTVKDKYELSWFVQGVVGSIPKS
ncbi:MAG TPA: BMP family ABC transporter substrate-binding protein [Nocardioidaceae bacterium]|nr:BMP family ABC transporter substrate-binding protein [Nocardioidaceae bacterium]